MESPMSKPFSKTKYLMRHQSIREGVRPSNIFQSCSPDEKSFGNMTMYSIVGDSSFKEKFYKERTMDTWQQNTMDRKEEERTKAVTINKHKLFSKLDKSKRIQCTNEKRIMEKVKKGKERDRRINEYLMKQSGKGNSIGHKTVTYGSIQQIYSHPNPQKMQLINDKIPEYWKQSLRDNDQRLKKHLKGNPFKKQLAEEMLQTMRGRSMIQKTVPSVKQEFVEPVCSKKAKLNFKKEGFSLSGKKMTINVEQLQNWQKKHARERLLPELQDIHTFQYDTKHKWKLHNLNL